MFDSCLRPDELSENEYLNANALKDRIRVYRRSSAIPSRSPGGKDEIVKWRFGVRDLKGRK